MCILHLGKNGLEKYRLAKKWEQFKIVLLFMDHPVPSVFFMGQIIDCVILLTCDSVCVALVCVCGQQQKQ